VGFVAGYLPLPQHLTVFEALDFFASLYGVRRGRLVVLDEPTASLDPDVAYRVRNGLRELSELEGMGLLVTSHNMVEVERLCDRVIFIQGGRIVAEGTPEDIAHQFDQSDLEGVFLQLAGTRDDRETGAIGAPLGTDEHSGAEMRP